MASSRPVSDLRRFVAALATGEFVCAGADVEVHVYLQRGRVAWATASTCPFEFSRFLRDRCGLDVDAFRQAVEECRQSRRPLGETLVEWGLVTREDVREAIAHQLRVALAELHATPTGQTIFLERRGFTSYNADLTFDLDECLERAATEPPPPRRSSFPPISSRDTTPSLLFGPAGVVTEMPAPPSIRFTDSLAREVMDRAMPGALGLVLARAGGALDACGAGVGWVPPPLGPEIDFVALRSPDVAVLGAQGLHDREHRLWCLVPDESYTSAIFTLLRQAAFPVRLATPVPGAGRSDVAWSFGIGGIAGGHELHEAVTANSGFRAALVLDGDGRPVCGLGTDPGGQEEAVTVALARRDTLLGGQPSAGQLASLGFRLRTFLAGDARLWSFGGELVQPGGATLWLLLERDVPQGLGWACLSALTRALGRAPVAQAAQ